MLMQREERYLSFIIVEVLRLSHYSLNALNIALQQKLLTMGTECDDVKTEKLTLQRQVDTYLQEITSLKEKIDVLVRKCVILQN